MSKVGNALPFCMLLSAACATAPNYAVEPVEPTAAEAALAQPEPAQDGAQDLLDKQKEQTALNQQRSVLLVERHLANAKARTEDLRFAEAEAELLAFISRYVPRNGTPMCGNSIGQDRRFLVKYMPKLESYFHYRNLDVSTLKELAKRWKPEVYESFKKHQKHTALADVHESIDELEHYRTHFLR